VNIARVLSQPAQYPVAINRAYYEHD